MDHLRQKFVLLLADPEISMPAFLRFCNWLQNGGLSTCIGQAKEIRALLSQSDAVAPDKSPESASDEQNAQYHKVISTIGRLLMEEAHLRSRQALELLADRLGYSRGFPEKISFGKGVLRLIDFANASTVLSAAQQIRNTAVHNGFSNTWPLREQSDEAPR